MLNPRNRAFVSIYEKSGKPRAASHNTSNLNIKEHQTLSEILFESLSKILIILSSAVAILYLWNNMQNLYYKGFLVFIIFIYSFAFLKFVSKKKQEFQQINGIIKTQILVKGGNIYKTLIMWLF